MTGITTDLSNGILHNSNGEYYKVLSLCEYNKRDKEYYKNSWQKYRFGLLKGTTGNYIVASNVGDTEWGQGYYYFKEDREVAEKLYSDFCTEYNSKE